jgi:hypothetical protein
MALKVNASFENGVFVPAIQPRLADRERVVLTVEPAVRPESEGGKVTGREGTAVAGPRCNRVLELDYHPDGC